MLDEFLNCCCFLFLKSNENIFMSQIHMPRKLETDVSNSYGRSGLPPEWAAVRTGENTGGTEVWEQVKGGKI